MDTVIYNNVIYNSIIRHSIVRYKCNTQYVQDLHISIYTTLLREMKRG